VNTFLLAAVAIALVAFLLFNRKRQKSAGAAPAKESSRAGSRGRGLKRGRGKKIDGYPEMSEAPATAVAETAASRTVAPVLEPLPPAEAVADPIVPVPSASAVADWGFDEMIVEPGWPMPGEIAGAWPAAAPAPEPPVSAPTVAVAVEEPLAPDPLADDAATGEWEMPAVDAPPAPDHAPWVEDDSRQDGEPAMEAWVPGVSEVEPVVVPEPEPEAEPAPEPEPEPIAPAEPEPEPEPALVWADPAPAADAVAEPVAWQPEPAGEPVAQAVDEPVEALLPAWEPEPAPEPAAVAVADVWHPAAGADHVAEGDPAAEIDEVARDLPLAVAALTPVLAAGDALGVTPRMAAVLRALADEPRGLPGLGRALGVSRPVVADVCARLEDLDLVWRERDPDDRRRMLVVPTARGLKLADEAVPGLDRDAVAAARILREA
jgi:DNA-binding MarR family transcriptional regulator